jgi:hypothetical protein
MLVNGSLMSPVSSLPVSGIPQPIALGSRLNYVHQSKIDAMATVEQKFLASLS